MKPLIFIQFGDMLQCERNAVPGWEYTLGKHINEKHYHVFNRDKGDQRFYCHPRDATNFKLEIIF